MKAFLRTWDLIYLTFHIEINYLFLVEVKLKNCFNLFHPENLCDLAALAFLIILGDLILLQKIL